MTPTTKKVLLAGGIAVGAASVLALALWPKKASAGSYDPQVQALAEKVALELDANLSDFNKKEIANLLINETDPEKLAIASKNADDMGADIAAKALAAKALFILRPKLDDSYPMPSVDPKTGAISKLQGADILTPLYLDPDPISVQSAALLLQSKGFPKAAALVGARAVELYAALPDYAPAPQNA